MKFAQDIVGLLKDITQIAFWILAAAIAILTYKQARRTVLQPIRTEVFKAQLQAITEILGVFLGKTELQLRSAFDFDNLFHVNVLALYDDFAANFFDIHFERGTRPYERLAFERSFSDSPGPAVDYIRKEVEPAAESAPDPRLRAARWASYKHPRLYINNEFMAMLARLSGILENPLLPSGLLELVAKYRSIAGENRSALQKLLVTVAQEMPQKYSSLDLFERASFNWIHNRYMEDFKHLKPTADEILKYIRMHFDAEEVMRG